MLMDSGDIVLIADSQGIRDSYEATGTSIDSTAPVSLLVNKGTASASEVCTPLYVEVFSTAFLRRCLVHLAELHSAITSQALLCYALSVSTQLSPFSNHYGG